MSEISSIDHKIDYPSKPVSIVDSAAALPPYPANVPPNPVYPQQINPQMNAAYPQPSNAIIVNQVVPVMPMVLSVNTRNSYSTICQFCRKQILTTSIESFNCCACLFCLWFGTLYFCFQCIKGKDCLCCDAVHKCPNCGQTIAVYSAC